MDFEQTILKGAFVIAPERRTDDRGFFARTFCQKEFEAHGLTGNVAQCNISFNRLQGTLRGMHYRTFPHAEAKLVRCTRGSIYDVIIDLRPHSATYGQWISIDLSEENCLMLYVPEGFAHGFQTLKDNSEVFYQMSQFYDPESERGIRHDDPAFRIRWPVKTVILSERDRTYPNFAL